MEALLNVTGVTTQQDIKGLSRLHDCVEAHMRRLEALKVPAQSYGGLLTSVLFNKLPPELRLIVTPEMTGESWDLEQLMKTFEREINAREHALIPTRPSNTQKDSVSIAYSCHFGSQQFWICSSPVCTVIEIMPLAPVQL